MNKKESLKDLQSLMNIGESISEDLYSLGIRSASEFMTKDPEKLYAELKKKSGGKLDKCVLYTFKGAKLNKKWWLCKD
ncbi:TfoX/Sxy family DNA transformation protein [Candidatus Micrarchaeota archaeon]|nr:TfoX/Sxy family DNA transformation protein [Candidatus Micrarchaeota archaeon]